MCACGDMEFRGDFIASVPGGIDDSDKLDVRMGLQ
jgi:hypothetical protein